MMQTRFFWCLLSLIGFFEIVQPICVLESDFGFKINCAFKKSGLFRVRNLGGLKAHASLGFSLGDELGFEQSLTNLDPSRRRSVSVKNGAPNLIAENTRTNVKQEKRGKQNRIMMRPVAPPNTRPNQAAMDKLTSLHRRASSTMQPIVVSGPTVESPTNQPRVAPTITMAKPLPMGVPPFKPLPPKEETLHVVPITTKFTPLQIPESKGPGLAYQSEIYPQSHNQISKMVSQMTAVQYAHPTRITHSPIIVEQYYTLPTTVNPFMPLPMSVAPISAPPTQALSIIPAPAFKRITQTNPSLSNPSILDSVPHRVHDIANTYAYNTKKVDDYNTITGYSDDTALKFNKEDINAKIAEIAKAGNISMEAVEAAIALRQQQLLNKYANVPIPTTTTTTTTEKPKPVVFQPDPVPEVQTPKPKRIIPTSGKVMNAPREYYPVGYEKNFDDHFQTKVDLPDTTFHCGDQKYFPGLYGDESLGCMVFHVCALTDDGLVMKSFLCPESTLFDQTILKCNWWFYVDCKNTRKLYDTNIPVSKSYQLMKALTFFSSYKKEMEDGRPKNPEDVEGIKEAITILENQDSRPQQSVQNTVQIITPTPLIDERNNKNFDNEPSPVYRNNRNLNITNDGRNETNPRNNGQRNSNVNIKNNSNEQVTLITVKAGFNFNESDSSSEARDKKHRRRMTFRSSNSTIPSKVTSTARPVVTSTAKNVVTTQKIYTTSKSYTSTNKIDNPLVEVIKQEIQPIENVDIKQEKLTDQLEEYKPDFNTHLPEVKRFYRSSAEKLEKEMTVVNNEKVQIVRPTPMARHVGHPTPFGAIAKLDEAVLGKRAKKEAITIVTSQRFTEKT